MTAADIRKLNETELQKKLHDLKAELFSLRFQMAVNQLENPQLIKKVRKNIARVKTVMRERELELEATSVSKG